MCFLRFTIAGLALASEAAKQKLNPAESQGAGEDDTAAAGQQPGSKNLGKRSHGTSDASEASAKRPKLEGSAVAGLGPPVGQQNNPGSFLAAEAQQGEENPGTEKSGKREEKSVTAGQQQSSTTETEQHTKMENPGITAKETVWSVTTLGGNTIHTFTAADVPADVPALYVRVAETVGVPVHRVKLLDGFRVLDPLEDLVPENVTLVVETEEFVLTAFGHRAKIWNAKTGECVQTLRCHASWVKSAVFSVDGSTVVTASNDKTAKIWNAKTGECVQTLSGHDGHWVNSAAFRQ